MTLKFGKLEKFENESLEETRKQFKWENDDHICCGHILNSMSDPLFDVESAKELDALESKYMAGDASRKNFFLSNFNNYKMFDSRWVMEQYSELFCILGKFTQHNMNPSWLRIEKSQRAQEGVKPKDKEVGTSYMNMNMMEESGSTKENNEKKRSINNNTNGRSNKKIKSIIFRLQRIK
ncbi:hypothetical protein EUTSA_v10024104mg [Eutrema salsugineum]|uniref:Uncharacterized protein n=1 Tax=Eutrema salsugineum TaxID=72664 RepID=V4KI32_EUTSA|nr:hypothetical protein EUTSA_v10024104mg [Eutrema salsugineum]